VSRDLIIDRTSLDMWAGRTLTDAEVERIAECVPYSSIPDAISVIATEAIVRFRWNDHANDLGDWCPHGEEPVTPEGEPDEDTADSDLARCPAGCRASRPVRVGHEDDKNEDDGKDGEDGEVCDECEEVIPDVENGHLDNRHHARSCSLYNPDNG